MLQRITTTHSLFYPKIFGFASGCAGLFWLACVTVVSFFVTFVFDTTFPDLHSAHVPLGIAGVSVALSTQIGSWGFAHRDNAMVSGISSVGVSSSIGQVTYGRDDFFAEHFRAIDSYVTLLQTDIWALLSQATNPESALDSYLDELRFRRADAVTRLTAFQVQSDAFSDELSAISQRISEYQQSIATSYDSRDSITLQDALSRVEQLRAREVDLRAQRAFVDKFSSDFSAAVAQTDPILSAIVPNKNAVLSGQTLQLSPDNSGLLESIGVVRFLNSR